MENKEVYDWQPMIDYVTQYMQDNKIPEGGKSVRIRLNKRDLTLGSVGNKDKCKMIFGLMQDNLHLMQQVEKLKPIPEIKELDDK